MYQSEMTIVSQPEVRRAVRTGEEFAVARCAVNKRVYHRGLGADITQTTYVGLVCTGRLMDELLPLGVGQRIIVTGEVRQEEFRRRDGSQGSDLKINVARIDVVQAAPEEEDDYAETTGLASARS
jgi:single-stranded DNA-binding protein